MIQGYGSDKLLAVVLFHCSPKFRALGSRELRIKKGLSVSLSQQQDYVDIWAHPICCTSLALHTQPGADILWNREDPPLTMLRASAILVACCLSCSACIQDRSGAVSLRVSTI